MDYMTLKEAAEKWGVTPRRVNYYCAAIARRSRRVMPNRRSISSPGMAFSSPTGRMS